MRTAIQWLLVLHAFVFVAVFSLEHDGHVIHVVEEDVTAFPTNVLHEVSIGGSIHRLSFSAKHMLVNGHRSMTEQLICRLPVAAQPGSPSVLNATVLEDSVLLDRVATAIYDELSNLPCITSRWSLGGTGFVEEGFEMYELCPTRHFRRVGKVRPTESYGGIHDEDSSGAPSIIFGLRAGSAGHKAKVTKTFLSQLKGGGEALYKESSGSPMFNKLTGRWELLMGNGDECVRHVDLPMTEVHNESIGRAPTMPFSTVLFFLCGQRSRNLDNSVNTYSVPRRLTINRDIGRCQYTVGVEAAAVCEWDARVRAATTLPILCNVI